MVKAFHPKITAHFPRSRLEPSHYLLSNNSCFRLKLTILPTVQRVELGSVMSSNYLYNSSVENIKTRLIFFLIWLSRPDIFREQVATELTPLTMQLC